MELLKTDAGNRPAEAAGSVDKAGLARDVFSEEFLIERPLLQALRSDDRGAPVLLIDELDRTDEPFEAFLLELLSENQISIPEIGTVRATEPLLVIITSNRTRKPMPSSDDACITGSTSRRLSVSWKLCRKMPGIDQQPVSCW